MFTVELYKLRSGNETHIDTAATFEDIRTARCFFDQSSTSVYKIVSFGVNELCKQHDCEGIAIKLLDKGNVISSHEIYSV